MVRFDLVRTGTVGSGWARFGMDKQKKDENKAISYRLPEKIKALIVILSQKLLISRTAVMTLAILHFAKKEDVEIEDEDV